MAAELEQIFLASWVGETLPVLFEEEKDGAWQGHAPNYTLVRAQGESLHNCLRQVRITAAGDGCLLGELV